VLKLRERGYKRAFIIKNGSKALKSVGFLWKGPDNVLRKIGPDGKVKKLGH